MVDLRKANTNVDLLALIEQDCGPGHRSGRWWMFHCPFPGHARGDKNSSMAVTPDNGRWHCFTCSLSGDAIGWLMKYRGVSYRDAKEYVNIQGFHIQSSPRIRVPIEHQRYDLTAWQERARKFVADAEGNLWRLEGLGALEYLHRRGLRDRLSSDIALDGGHQILRVCRRLGVPLRSWKNLAP